MRAMNSTRLKNWLQATVFMRNDVAMIHGAPGIGKSSVVAQLAAANSAHLIDYRLTMIEGVDLRGMPDVRNDATHWIMPSDLPFVGNPHFDHIDDNTPIMVFFDEIVDAADDVKAPMYQVLLDRRVGQHVLRDNVRIVCAGNRTSDRGLATDLPTPLKDRMCHAELVMDVDAWVYNYAIPAGLPSIGIAFIKARPALLDTFQTDRDQMVFSTPRSVDMALRADADDRLSQEVRFDYIAGRCGEGWAREYEGFKELAGKVTTIKQILADPDNAPVPSMEDGDTSMCYMQAASCAGHMSEKTADTINRYIKRLPKDFYVLCWTLAVNNPRIDDVHNTRAYVDFAQDHKDLLKQVHEFRKNRR